MFTCYYAITTIEADIFIQTVYIICPKTCVDLEWGRDAIQ